MLTYPYQLDVVPVGCYCQEGFTPDCPSIPQQTADARAQFSYDWDRAKQEPRLAHFAAQHFALRYGWKTRDTVESLVRERSPHLMPYLQTLSCAPVPSNTSGIYSTLLNRAF